MAAHLRGGCQFLWDPTSRRHSKLAQRLSRKGFSVLARNEDFLLKNSLPESGIEDIVSNPPFGIGRRMACHFIAHALGLVPIVAMLLRIDFDSAKMRTIRSATVPPSVARSFCLIALSGLSAPERGGPSDNHAWYLWDRQHQGPLIIRYARRPK